MELLEEGQDPGGGGEVGIRSSAQPALARDSSTAAAHVLAAFLPK